MNTKNIFLAVLLLSITSSFTQLYPQTHLSGGQAYGWINLRNNLPELVGLNDVHFVGNEIATLVNEEKPAGEYEVDFNGNGLSSGVYFYQIKTGNYIQTKKMLLIK